ncbi:MAG: LamG domain-containing protein, partial [Planctomycetes bacterium]|nr:LamG domain-containing protein [Planctomycetota bacterium]
MTGPYASFDWKSDAKITNEVAAGVEVYLGRFSEDFRKIEEWIMVTHNQRGDYFPDAWIEPKAEARAKAKPPKSAATPAKAKAEASDEGLQFLFTDLGATNQTPEADGKRIRLCGLTLTGRARYGRSGVCEVTGGVALASHAEQVIQACRTAGAFSLSCTVIPAAAQNSDPAIIAAFADATGKTDLALIQAGGRLFARLNTSSSGASGATLDLGELVALKPLHVAVTFAAGRMRCYLDGRRALVGEEVPGDLKAWTAKAIRFGDDGSGTRRWSGSLCDLAIRSRAIDASEAAAHAAQASERARNRAPAARAVVDAVMSGHTPAADPKAIAPYVRCLSLSTYDVTSVVEGTLDAKRIAVWQWSVMDGKRLPEYEAMKVGATYRIVLEAFSDHPEQGPERQTNTLEDTLDLPEFYDIAFATPPAPMGAEVRWTGADSDNAVWAGAGASPWSKIGGPSVNDVAVFDVARAKRTVTIDRPTVIGALTIRQPAAAPANVLVVKAPLRIGGGAAPALATV